MHQLAHSYQGLDCFKHYEMLLDIQKVFEPRGGLSGLVKLEYAALDAVVLVHLFHHIGSHSQPIDVQNRSVKMEWKSHIVSTSIIMRIRSQSIRRKWCCLVRLVIVIDVVVCIIL